MSELEWKLQHSLLLSKGRVTTTSHKILWWGHIVYSEELSHCKVILIYSIISTETKSAFVFRLGLETLSQAYVSGHKT